MPHQLLWILLVSYLVFDTASSLTSEFLNHHVFALTANIEERLADYHGRAARVLPPGTIEEAPQIDFTNEEMLRELNLIEDRFNGSKAEAEEEGDLAEPGMLLKVKRLDEIFDRKRHEWLTRNSVASPNKDKKDKYAAFAFTVNKKFHPTPDPTLHRITVVLDIKSPYIKQLGMTVIGSSSGVSWTSRPLKVLCVFLLL